MRTRAQVVDEILVLEAQAGRVEAFEDLACRWNSRLLRHAARLTGDAEASRDVVQESWIAVVRGLSRLKDPASFGAWALRITGRRAADWISGRSRHRRTVSGLDDAAAVTESGDRSADNLLRARELIRRLEPEGRELMILFYVEGMTVAEIARAYEIPPGTVKSRLFNARQRLRAALEVHHETHE